MDWETIAAFEPWQWPAGTDHVFRAVLCDRKADPAARLKVATIAGDIPDMTETLANALLGVVEESSEPEELRAKAAISLGPPLELWSWDEDEPEELTIPVKTYRKIMRRLERLYSDINVPKLVRRRILEVAVRAPQEPWHPKAVGEAYASDDPEWKLTAVFCARYIRGFDQPILDNLSNPDAELRFQAVNAAGERGLDAAFPKVAELALHEADRDIRLAAIEALGTILPAKSLEILSELADDPDEEIAEVAHEAMESAESFRLNEGEEVDDDDLSDEDEEEDEDDDDDEEEEDEAEEDDEDEVDDDEEDEDDEEEEEEDQDDKTKKAK